MHENETKFIPLLSNKYDYNEVSLTAVLSAEELKERLSYFDNSFKRISQIIYKYC